MALLSQPIPRHDCSSTQPFRGSFGKTTHTENTVYPTTLQIRAGLRHHNRDISSMLPALVWGFYGKEMKRVKGKNGQLWHNYQDEYNHTENCKTLFHCSYSLTSCWFLHHPHCSPAAILLPLVPHVQVTLQLCCSTPPLGMWEFTISLYTKYSPVQSQPG